MSAAFDAAIAWLSSWEGEHSADPADPGGDTWWGLSRVAHPTMPWPPTREAAVAVYRTDYWTAAGCDRLPDPLAVALFDAAVNEGVTTAVRLFQRALGVTPDGVLGPVTAAAAAKREPADLLAHFLVVRAMAYTQLADWRTFGSNWMTRLFLVHRVCLSLL